MNVDPHAACAAAVSAGAPTTPTTPTGSDCACRTGTEASACARRGCGFCRAYFGPTRRAVESVATEVSAFTDPVTIEDCALVRDAVRARVPAIPAPTSVEVYARRDDVAIAVHVGQVEVASVLVRIAR